jgi:two-component system chemotaxis response regulator CheY
MHLKDMTGMEFARQLRAEAALATVGFILISSESDAHEAHSLSQAGHFIRLTKPFSADQLDEALKVATGSAPRSTPDANPDAVDPIRILLVDDSVVARSHVRRALVSSGLERIVEAKDGEQAVALLEKEPFDLVVTDYNMPNLDGRGLIDYIRNRSSNPSVPVILVTTETDEAKLEAVRRLGVSAICDKNVPVEVIRQILQRRGEGHV